MYSGGLRRDHPPARSPNTNAVTPSRSASPAGKPAVALALDLAATAGGATPLVTEVFEHSGRDEPTRFGLP